MMRLDGVGRSVALTAVTTLAAAVSAPVSPPVWGQERGVATEEAGRLLVDATWLAGHLDDPELVVLQVGPEELYGEEHVPGARHVSLDLIERPMPPGPHDTHLVLELPPVEDLRETLEGWGLSDGSLAVVVPAEGWVTLAARLVFTLDYMGLGARTRFLDGGLESWKAEGNPVTAAAPTVARGRLTSSPSPRRVDHEWILEHASSPGYALLDGRAPAFYDGVRDDRGKRGHIPGARSLPWTELVVEGPGEDDPVLLQPPATLRRLFRDAGVEEGDTVVAYCHIGQYASMVLLAARVLGHEVRLYDGSMNEWAILDLPVEGRGGG